MPYPLSGGCRRVRIPPRCRLSHVEPASGAPATNLFLNQSLTIAYRSPEPRARSPPLSFRGAFTDRMRYPPRPSGARPRCAPGLHPALRSSSSLAHRLGPEGPSLRLALPSGRTGLARSNRIAPRIRAPQDTSRRPGARGLSRMCAFVQVRKSLPARGPLVPDPRTSCRAVMCATGVVYPRVRFIVRALLETARCKAEPGL